MSTISLTHAHSGRASTGARRFFERVFESLIAARTAQAAPTVAAALARASNEELAAIGRSPSEIAAIRAAGRTDFGRPVF